MTSENITLNGEHTDAEIKTMAVDNMCIQQVQRRAQPITLGDRGKVVVADHQQTLDEATGGEQ